MEDFFNLSKLEQEIDLLVNVSEEVVKEDESLEKVNQDPNEVVREESEILVNENNIKMRHYFIADAFYFAPQLLFVVYFFYIALFMNYVDFSTTTFQYIFWSPYAIFQVLGLVGLLYTFKKLKINLFKRKKVVNEKKLLLWFTPLYIIVPNLIFEFLMKQTTGGTTYNQQMLNELLETMPFIVTLIAVVIVGPIFEEILFRGIPLFYYKKGRPQLRMVLSSVAFSLMHVPTDVLSFAIYFILGYLLAWLVNKTDRMEPSIIVHMLNNFFSVVLPYIF